MPTLEGAVARRHDNHVAVSIREALGLHVTGLVEEAFNKALSATESGNRLAGGGVKEFWNLLARAGHLETATTAAEGGLDGDGEAVLVRKSDHLVGRADGVGSARHQRCSGALCNVASAHLVAKRLNGRRRWANPYKPGIDDGLSEVGVL